MEQTKMVGEVIETLIRIKDKVYGHLSFEEREALNDACNLLEKNLGNYSRYDYTCMIHHDDKRNSL